MEKYQISLDHRASFSPSFILRQQITVSYKIWASSSIRFMLLRTRIYTKRSAGYPGKLMNTENSGTPLIFIGISRSDHRSRRMSNYLLSSLQPVMIFSFRDWNRDACIMLRCSNSWVLLLVMVYIRFSLWSIEYSFSPLINFQAGKRNRPRQNDTEAVISAEMITFPTPQKSHEDTDFLFSFKILCSFHRNCIEIRAIRSFLLSGMFCTGTSSEDKFLELNELPRKNFHNNL